MKYANVYELLSGKPIETVEVKEDAELTNVMQYLNQKYNSDDAVIRVETTASNSITDPLNVIVGARFQLEARIAKIVRSVLKEGVLQPPPRMTKQIQDWAQSVYYGHVWAVAEELLAAARVSPEDKIKAVEDAVNKFVADARKAMSDATPNVRFEAKFTIGKYDYTLEFGSGIGLYKEVFFGIHQYRGKDQIRVPKSSSDPSKIEPVLRDLDHYVNLAHAVIIRYTPEERDQKMVECTHIIEECKKYAAKPKYYKSAAKANFKCDISDWKYIQDNAEVADRAQGNVQSFELPVSLNFSGISNGNAASYKYKQLKSDGAFIKGSSQLEIDMHVPNSDFTLNSVRDVDKYVRSLIFHEMQHFSQYELGLSAGKAIGFGHVDKRISNPPNALAQKLGGPVYYLQDDEFQTWIGSSIADFEREYRKYLKPGVTARDLFGQFIGIKPRERGGVQTTPFFSALKASNIEKWKVAVKTVATELQKRGIL